MRMQKLHYEMQPNIDRWRLWERLNKIKATTYILKSRYLHDVSTSAPPCKITISQERPWSSWERTTQRKANTYDLRRRKIHDLGPASPPCENTIRQQGTWSAWQWPRQSWQRRMESKENTYSLKCRYFDDVGPAMRFRIVQENNLKPRNSSANAPKHSKKIRSPKSCKRIFHQNIFSSKAGGRRKQWDWNRNTHITYFVLMRLDTWTPTWTRNCIKLMFERIGTLTPCIEHNQWWKCWKFSGIG